MTDMPATHIIRNPNVPQQRSLLSAALTAPLGVMEALLRTLMTAVAHRPTSSDVRIRAERALLAQRMQEKGRRKVDRLML